MFPKTSFNMLQLISPKLMNLACGSGPERWESGTSSRGRALKRREATGLCNKNIDDGEFYSQNSREDEGGDLNTRILVFQMGGDYLPTIDDDLGWVD